MEGWIKLHRSLTQWQWYDDINATRLLIHLLLTVNYSDKKWRGEVIKAGSRVISWEHLSQETGLSVRQCRVAMVKLINSKEVTKRVTNKYQVVSLVKWRKLQSDDKRVTNSKSGKGQAKGRQVTTTKEIKEYKEHKEKRKADFKKSLIPYLEIYSKEMLRAFYEYWTESGERARKLRFEKEKAFDIKRRLSTWKKNESKYGGDVAVSKIKRTALTLSEQDRFKAEADKKEVNRIFYQYCLNGKIDQDWKWVCSYLERSNIKLIDDCWEEQLRGYFDELISSDRNAEL